MRTVEPAVLTPAILAKLGDWSGLMGRRVAQARQLLRHLLVGRITFTPQDDGMVEFVGYGSLGPLVAGTVLDGLGKAGVSPTGHVSSALLARVYLLFQAYATLRFRPRGRWRLKSGGSR